MDVGFWVCVCILCTVFWLPYFDHGLLSPLLAIACSITIISHIYKKKWVEDPWIKIKKSICPKILSMEAVIEGLQMKALFEFIC